MRKILKLVLTIICLFTTVQINGESKFYDMSNIEFKMLTEHVDQSENIKVSKFINKQTGRVAFCIEPTVAYNTAYNYLKQAYENEELFNVFRAYEEIGKEDEKYYIASQLLIWKIVSGVNYTINGNDLYYYDGQDILDKIDEYEEEVDTTSLEYDAYYGVDNVIDDIDFSKYTIESDDIDIVNLSDNSLTYKLKDTSKEDKYIYLMPKISKLDGSFIYKSSSSQNLFSYESDYTSINNIVIKINTIYEDNLSINFTKKDELGNYIQGAKFDVYDLENDNSDEELYFIHINKDINLYEILLDDYISLDNNKLRIEVSERYDKYINNGLINTNEVGYFPYRIFYENILYKEGRVYVSDDINQTDNLYKKYNVKSINNTLTKNIEVNSVDGLHSGSKYYLCESEPAKGYAYSTNACQIVDTYTDQYKQTFNYVNKQRKYTLRLVKENPERTIYLDGAKFKIEYIDEGINKEIILTTGALNIKQENDYKYLFYCEEGRSINTYEFVDDELLIDNAKPGKYYYYQSNEYIIDYNLLDKVTYVVDGGLKIDDLPYSSGLKITELQAPKGYFIEEATYYLNCDIPYSEITFKNTRVNSAIIIPKKFKIPNTYV